MDTNRLICIQVLCNGAKIQVQLTYLNAQLQCNGSYAITFFFFFLWSRKGMCGFACGQGGTSCELRRESRIARTVWRKEEVQSNYSKGICLYNNMEQTYSHCYCCSAITIKLWAPKQTYPNLMSQTLGFTSSYYPRLVRPTKMLRSNKFRSNRMCNLQ